MKLRCKDGDLAVVTWDYLDCFGNLGRVVQVRGPVKAVQGHDSWLIQPVDSSFYSVLNCCKESYRGTWVSVETVTWESDVWHPDAWLEPLSKYDGVASDTTALRELSNTVLSPDLTLLVVQGSN